MTRWLPRALWGLAWSGWVWLGVGLYRELPRMVGPMTCPPFLTLGTRAAGFLAQSDHIVVIAPNAESDTSVLVYDGETGRTIRTIPGPSREDFRWPLIHPRHRNVLLANRSSPDDSPGLYALDLAAGAWRKLQAQPIQSAILHGHRSWVLIAGDATDGVGRQIAILDYATGDVVCPAIPYASNSMVGHPFWVGDDRFIVRTKADDSSTAVEVWRVGKPPSLEKRLTGVMLNGTCAASDNGRVACAAGWDVDVFDLDVGRFIFSHGLFAEHQPGKSNASAIKPMINGSGTRVFAGNPGVLWDVESGRAIWSSGDAEIGFPMDSTSTFRSIESWSRNWSKWFPRKQYFTQAVRSLESGSVLYRIPDDLRIGSNLLTEQGINERGTLVVRDDGSVYRWPPRVNYPLLALCQTILTLPLIFLWAVLRWRRKRKRRPASTAI